MLFPEGARQSGPIVQPLFDGAVYVAAKAGVPIVPVGVGGSERCMPKGSKLIYPHKIHVIVGDPIAPPAIVGRRVDRAEFGEDDRGAVEHPAGAVRRRADPRRCPLTERPRQRPAMPAVASVSRCASQTGMIDRMITTTATTLTIGTLFGRNMLLKIH